MLCNPDFRSDGSFAFDGYTDNFLSELGSIIRSYPHA